MSDAACAARALPNNLKRVPHIPEAAAVNPAASSRRRKRSLNVTNRMG